MKKIVLMFRVLQYTNFKFFFSGMVIGQIGIWIQNVAISWVVYNMTQSAFLMGFVMFLNALPQFLVTPFAGVIIDKYSKKQLLIYLQVMYAVLSFIFIILALMGKLFVWNIALLGILINVVSSFDPPLRQSLYVQMIKNKNELSNAISLNSSCINIARFIGPAIGTVLMLNIGIGACFIATFLCFIASLYLFYMVKITDNVNFELSNNIFAKGVLDGLNYIKNDYRVFIILTIFVVFCFFGMVYPTLIPIYASDVLNSDIGIYGSQLSFVGIGALLTSLIIASIRNTDNFKYILFGGIFTFSISFILLSLVHNNVVSVILMLLIGAGMTSTVITTSSLIQTIIPNEKRGRIMSIHSLFFFAPPAINSLLSGYIVHYIGINATLLIYGLILFALNILFFYKLKKLTF